MPRMRGESRHGLTQRRLLVAAREAFLRDVALLDGDGVTNLLGSGAPNDPAMAKRLRQEGKLFAIRYQGRDLYPAAQIVDGAPSPAIPQILAAFSSDSPWTLALWLAAPCGWLDGRTPISLIATDPDRVARAALKTTERIRF